MKNKNIYQQTIISFLGAGLNDQNAFDQKRYQIKKTMIESHLIEKTIK